MASSDSILVCRVTRSTKLVVVVVVSSVANTVCHVLNVPPGNTSSYIKNTTSTNGTFVVAKKPSGHHEVEK